MKNTLYIVVPCYNEQEVLIETMSRLREKLEKLMETGKVDRCSRVLFVDDGSKDKTWELIEKFHEENKLFSGLKLSRNRGHQNALLAGLMNAKEKADMVISMDADLQDDVDAIDEMVERFLAGADIVYGVRSNRKKDSFFKRFTAQAFYRLMNLMGANVKYNHADYRLMSRRALEGLAQFKEVNLFLRGVVPMVGYSSEVVYYERNERFAGESKYPLRKMVAFAVEGITSLSITPLRLITNMGILVFMVSIVMLIYSFVRHFMGETIVGWTTLMVSVWAIGGLILLAIGVVGEYIGKIYLEAKGRPRFIIEKELDAKERTYKGRKEIFSFRIICTHAVGAESEEGHVNDVYFTGYCESELFTGTILPGAVDHQVTGEDGVTRLHASYTFDGVDKDGKRCTMHVENSKVGDDYVPVITTDSQGLKWLETADLIDLVEFAPIGPTIIVFA